MKNANKHINYKELLSFYKGKRVLITGNTGFKGSWLTHILLKAGASVIGYALQPSTEPNLFTIAGLDKRSDLTQRYADVRDLEELKFVFKATAPEIVFHLAAQPIVRDSFRDPVTTYSINVMGTVNVCECIRTVKGVKSFLNVTTDKVYRNNEWCYGYREDDILDGFDPYSNSKSCAELVTHSYKDSFFRPVLMDEKPVVRVSAARAGNVIGGGDFSNDRIIPDCVRALQADGKIIVRNPYSTRPYEHVLEPLFVYLMIAAKQYESSEWSGYYNVGPDDIDCIATGDLVDLFCNVWNEDVIGESGAEGIKAVRVDKIDPNSPHEANFLKLDCSKLKATFNWKPTWHINTAIEQTIVWTKVWMSGGDIVAEMNREIDDFTS